MNYIKEKSWLRAAIACCRNVTCNGCEYSNTKSFTGCEIANRYDKYSGNLKLVSRNKWTLKDIEAILKRKMLDELGLIKE